MVVSVVASDVMMLSTDENQDSSGDSDEDFQFIWPEPKRSRSLLYYYFSIEKCWNIMMVVDTSTS